MARYTVLHHQVSPDSGREDHFDLLLEESKTLLTWELPFWPPVEPQKVKRLPDHRKAYLDFEGELSDDRGSVSKVCTGSFEFRIRTERMWVLDFVGQEFTGVITLRSGKLDDDSADANEVWTATVETS